MSYYYHYFCEKKEKVCEILIKYGIKFKSSFYAEIDKKEGNVYFDLRGDQRKVDIIRKELNEIGIKEIYVGIEYTERERTNAKWLWVMPKRQSIDIVNEDAFRYYCERENAWGEKLMTHVEQTGNITIRKEPNLSTSTAFWASTTGFAELYTDYRVKEIAQMNDLKGLELLEVKLRNGSYSDKIYQMMTRDRLRREVIGKGYGEKIIKCPVCGKEQYGIDSSYQLRMDLNKVSEERDFYMTEDIFGEGFAHPLYVISQRFYRILKENKLVGGVNFNPVANVDPC